MLDSQYRTRSLPLPARATDFSLWMSVLPSLVGQSFLTAAALLGGRGLLVRGLLRLNACASAILTSGS
jgi:hypothetical protein